MRFKVGQRFKYNDRSDSIRHGKLGTIFSITRDGALAEFDDEIGHDGDGECKPNHGWWVSDWCLTPVEKQNKSKPRKREW